MFVEMQILEMKLILISPFEISLFVFYDYNIHEDKEIR